MKSHINHIRYLVLSLVLFIGSISYSQQYPVSVVPQASIPGPVYLYHYANSSSLSKPLQVQLLLTDLTVPQREVRLKVYIEGRGIQCSSTDAVIGASPIYLEGGVPFQLGGADLNPYFKLENLIGVTPVMYSQLLSDGSYQFCFEVYDVLTGQRLSKKSCAMTYLLSNPPPILNLPLNGEKLFADGFKPIFFQWTPRHTNVSNVEYEFKLVELWDANVSPEVAFRTLPPIFETTIRTTSYSYDATHPQLNTNKRYAWQVRAKALDGLDEIGVFKNNGESEIHSFWLLEPCDDLLGVSAKTKGVSKLNVFWDEDSSRYKSYTIAYRKQSGASKEWFTQTTNSGWATLWDLEPDTVYEVKVKGNCLFSESMYSSVVTARTKKTQRESANYNCGIVPAEVSLKNRTPNEGLVVGEIITAGDFKIKLLSINSQSNGRITGVGKVRIPYLYNQEFSVVFDNILVNTENQLIEGEIVTTYDKTFGADAEMSASVEVTKGIKNLVSDTLENVLEKLGISEGEYNEESITFEVEDIVVNKKGETIAIGSNGEKKNLGTKKNTIVTDKKGKVIAVNDKGNIGLINSEKKIESKSKEKEPYYVEVKGRTKKYEYNDNIYFVRQKKKGILTLKTAIDSLKFNNPKWMIGKTKLGEGHSISIDLKKLKNKKIDIVDIDDSSKKFKIKIVIYEKPIVTLQTGGSFDGSFGFDNAKQEQLRNSGDYNPEFTDSIFHKNFSINKINKYFLQWVTLVPNQPVNLKINNKFISKRKIRKDSNFSLTFKSSTPHLIFNYSGTQELKVPYDDLDFPIGIQVGSVDNRADFNNPHAITVYDQSNEIVGKINVVLGKIKEQKTDIVLVRVKHDENEGYTQYNINSMIHMLNNQAYNQAFINCEYKFTDTLDITTEYNADPSTFHVNSRNTLNKIQEIYIDKNHTIDSDKYYVFVTGIRVTDDEGKNIAGTTARIGGNILILFKDRKDKTIIHELGHCLGLRHTFSNQQGIRKILKGGTNSFMDYSARRNMFFLFQLKHLFNK